MDVATASVSGQKLCGNTAIFWCHRLLLGFSTWNMEYIGSPYSQHNQSVSRIQGFICQVWSQLSRFYSSDLWSRELVSINGFISKQKEFKSASSAEWLQSWELLRHTNPTSGWPTRRAWHISALGRMDLSRSPWENLRRIRGLFPLPWQLRGCFGQPLACLKHVERPREMWAFAPFCAFWGEEASLINGQNWECPWI